MPRIALALLPLAALAAAACQEPAAPAPEAPSTRNQPVAAPAPEAVEAASTKAASGETGDDTSTRYACEHGHSVIVRGGIARVSLADGRVVEIPRIADSFPPRYSGVALSFDVGSGGATLGQHEVGGFACREAD